MSSRTPASLAELPAQTVRPLGELAVDRLREWARQARHRFVAVECSACADRKSVLAAIGRGFGLPDWYGANLDALYDCLTDLPERGEAGWVVVIERLPGGVRFNAEQRAALLEVFRDAAEDFAERGLPLRVFYS